MKVKVTFYVSTRYVGSDVKEEIELDFEDDTTGQEIEEQVNAIHEEWVWNNIDAGWSKS